MGNCCGQTFKAIKKKRAEKTVVILIVGLDNSGKSLVLKRISGDNSNYVVPTVGFRTVNLKYKTVKVKVYDLGGGPQIRAIWPKYYADVYGIIYVVDASDTSRLSENKDVFTDLVSHDNIAGKPILLLANKQDSSYAMDELDLVENLEVEKVVNNMKCLTRVETCSCIISDHNNEYNMNGIIEGYKWLIETIIKNYTYINSRVKLAEKLQNNKRRKSSISSRLSAWSSSYAGSARQDLNNKQENVTIIDANANASKSSTHSKFFLSARNKTAPVSNKFSVEPSRNALDINVSVHRSPSQKDGFLEKPAQVDLELKRSVSRSIESARRPQTAPQVIENNFFN